MKKTLILLLILLVLVLGWLMLISSPTMSGQQNDAMSVNQINNYSLPPQLFTADGYIDHECQRDQNPTLAGPQWRTLSSWQKKYHHHNYYHNRQLLHGDIVLENRTNLSVGKVQIRQCKQATALTWKLAVHDMSTHGFSPGGFVFTSVSEISEILLPGDDIRFYSNMKEHVEIKQLRPSSHVHIIACFGDFDSHSTKKRDKRKHKCQRSPQGVRVADFIATRPSEVCIFAEDNFSPRLFQHHVINTIPIRGIAASIQYQFMPNATLVALYPTAFQTPGRGDNGVEVKLMKDSKCALTLFVSPTFGVVGKNESLMGVPVLHTTLDCYPQGSFEYARRSMVFNDDRRRLLIYASRDKSSRSPSPKSSLELERVLKSFASEFGLTYIRLGGDDDAAFIRSKFVDARVVVGLHGGMLANIFFSAKDTTVVEIVSARQLRFCFFLHRIQYRV